MIIIFQIIRVIILVETKVFIMVGIIIEEVTIIIEVVKENQIISIVGLKIQTNGDVKPTRLILVAISQNVQFVTLFIIGIKIAQKKFQKIQIPMISNLICSPKKFMSAISIDLLERL